MADNIVLNAGTGGDTLAARDVSSVKHQKVVTEFDKSGTVTQTSLTDPLPVNAVLSTSSLMAAGTQTSLKFVSIGTATSGNNELVAAVAAKKIRVVSLALFAGGAVDVYFNDGTANLLGGTRKVKLDNSGVVGIGAFVMPFNPGGWFETAAINRALNLNLSGAVGVAGCLTYVEV